MPLRYDMTMQIGRFELETDESSGTLWSPDREHYLRVSSRPLLRPLDVHFKTLPTTSVTTGRSLDQYKKELPDLEIDDAKQYVEVGAGFSGLLHHLAMRLLGNERRPIAIDPVDYALAEEMLIEALKLSEKGEPFFSPEMARICEVLAQCQTIRDRSKVLLINTNLSTALNEHPEIAGTADYVVDLHGPSEYSHTEHGNVLATSREEFNRQTMNIITMEQALLKPGGTILTDRR